MASQRYNADQPEDLLTLGAFYAQRERFDSAVAAYREALRRAPTYVTASIYLAGALRAQGRVDDALRALEDARRRSPDDPRIAAMLRTFQPAR